MKGVLQIFGLREIFGSSSYWDSPIYQLPFWPHTLDKDRRVRLIPNDSFHDFVQRWSAIESPFRDIGCAFKVPSLSESSFIFVWDVLFTFCSHSVKGGPRH